MTVDFPPFAPSSRQYTDGDWPVKEYSALNGYGVRIVYGSRQTGMKLNLVYQNLRDAEAALFLDHYQQQKGTFEAFQFFAPDGPKKGWGAGATSAELSKLQQSPIGKYLGTAARFSNWRYAESPTIQSVKPGISTVTVNLVSVLA